MGVFGVSTAGRWPRVTRSRVTPPSTLPITIADAASYLRIDLPDEHAVLQTLIEAATSKVETDTGLALLPQTWEFGLSFPADNYFDLPIAPVQSIQSVAYINTDGDETEWDADNYLLTDGRVWLADYVTWPTDTRSTAAVTVRVIAGYADASAIPSDLLHAIRLLLLPLEGRREMTTFEWAMYESWTGQYKRVLVV
jgi:uncharacterized phiE125 gp8 family phage protein